MLASVRLFPAPDGPKRTVTPGGTSNETSMWSPRGSPFGSITSRTDSAADVMTIARER